MNKFGVVLGVAVVATLAGCKDPDYKHGARTSQNDVKPADSVVEVEPAPQPIVVEQEKEPKPIAVVDMTNPPVEEKQPEQVVAETPVVPETTEYIVQRGDYLAKISKKFNIKVDAIRKANPQIKKDIVRVGQKIKLPGKVDVGEQKVPEGAIAKPVAAKKAYTPYTGATKEYVVKSGDSLGKIAYANGINIRQLKELNSLSKDSLKIGQKLKIPAEKVVKAPAVAAKATKDEVKIDAKAAEKPADKPVVVEPEVKQVEPQSAPVVETAPVVAAPVAAPDAQPVETSVAEEDCPVYVVQEGEDLTSIAVRWVVSPSLLREINNITDDSQVKPGMKLKLPVDAAQ